MSKPKLPELSGKKMRPGSSFPVVVARLLIAWLS